MGRERILEAMQRVPREKFAGAPLSLDRPVPIGHGQTSSAPSIILDMLALLDPQPGEKALDVGAGCGYVSALLKTLVGNGRVIALERIPELAEKSRALLEEYGVEVRVGDGSKGLPEEAPFDLIHVGAAASERVFFLLAQQLSPKGRIVCPVKAFDHQILRFGRREGPKFVWRDLYPVVFVELVE